MEFYTSLNLCRVCPHHNQLDDDREGNVVCTDCGLVIEPIYQNNIKNLHHQIYKDKNIDATIIKTSKICNNLDNETNELDILCNKLHLYSVTKTQVLEKWELIKKWFFDKKIKDRKKPQFKKGLIVMAIYQTLIDLDIPRPMSHLCQDAGIVPKYVWYWIKLYDNTYENEHKVSILKPSSMSEYFLRPLSLSYKEIKDIEKLVDKNNVLTYAPQTILAACAYMFLRKQNKQSPSIKKLAKLLGVSVMSVYRCTAAIKNNA